MTSYRSYYRIPLIFLKSRKSVIATEIQWRLSKFSFANESSLSMDDDADIRRSARIAA